MKVPLTNNDKIISVDKITLNVTLEGGEKAQVEYDVKGGVPVWSQRGDTCWGLPEIEVKFYATNATVIRNAKVEEPPEEKIFPPFKIEGISW